MSNVIGPISGINPVANHQPPLPISWEHLTVTTKPGIKNAILNRPLSNPISLFFAVCTYSDINYRKNQKKAELKKAQNTNTQLIEHGLKMLRIFYVRL
jgi:hypothetical protein